MIPKLIGPVLWGADRTEIGHIRNRKLVILGPRSVKWPKDEVKVCAFAVMEFGGAFDCVWVNDTETGQIFGIDTADLRRVLVDDKKRHILQFDNHIKLLDENDIRLRVPGFTRPE